MVRLNCTICTKEISADRIVGGVAYCTCGASMSLSSAPAPGEGRSASVKMIVFTALLVGAIIHAFNWDNHFFRIIPLKMKQLGGFASTAELKQIATICESRQKKACVVQAYERAYQLDNKEIDGLLRAAEIYAQMKQAKLAVQAYTLYFKGGGKDFEARYGFALALAEAGYVKDAKKQYQYILGHDRSKPQFQVARSYVELLMANNEFSQARTVIADYRRAGSTSAMFLEKEWKLVHQKLGIQVAARSGASDSPFRQ